MQLYKMSHGKMRPVPGPPSAYTQETYYQASDVPRHMAALMMDLEFDNDQMRRAITELSRPDQYWDHRKDDDGWASIGDMAEFENPGTIVRLRPIHELPAIYVLIGENDTQVLASRKEAEAARAEMEKQTDG